MQTFLPLEDLAAITTNIEIRGVRREIFSRAPVPENFWMVAVYLQTFLRQQYLATRAELASIAHFSHKH